MKKYIGLILLFFVAICTSGCDSYIMAQSQNDNYYGVFKQRDLIQADVKLIKKEPHVVCDGVMFLNPKSRILSYKDNNIDANLILGCSDKSLIKARLKVENRKFKNISGQGFDQFDNMFIFSSISEKEFKKEFGNEKITPVSDNTPSLLKY